MESHARAFFGDPRVIIVVLLIVGQLLAALAVAVKTKRFDPAALADYYQTRVIPYLLGAFIAWLFTRFLPTEPLGPYKVWVDEGLFTLAWFTLVWTLVTKFIRTYRQIGYAIPEDPEPPPPFEPSPRARGPAV